MLYQIGEKGLFELIHKHFQNEWALRVLNGDAKFVKKFFKIEKLGIQ